MRLKRIISSILAAALSLTILPSIPAKAETGSKIYTYDGYQVEYTVQNEWINNQTVQVTLTNTDDESILNWALKYDAKGKISGLWNASVYKEENTDYIIKNAGYNYEIQPNQSVYFGYTLTGTGENFAAPDKFEMCTKRVDKADGYDVSFNITQEWDTGFDGTITVNNPSSSAIEGWKLSFDSNFTIVDLWNGKILDSNGTSYTVANQQWTSPIQPNSSVTIGLTATKTAGTAAIAQNFKLSEVVIDDTPVVVINPETTVITAAAVYDSENKDIKIGWTPTNQNGMFDVLVSNDGINFASVGSVADKYSYIYTPNETIKTVYIKVKQTIDNITSESNVVTVTCSTEVINWEDQTDTDNDGLPDVYETYQFNTDPKKADTDGDGLPDGYEVSTLNTDPTLTDTNENEISDADEDFDDDKLNNLKEYELGTNPLNSDSDDDSLLDYDEVSTYGTNPLKSDTDGDGLLDNEEGKNGIFFVKYGVYFDPSNPDTNGNGILDGQEQIENQTVSQAVESHDGGITNIFVKMTTNDNLERNLSVESVYNEDVLSTNVVGLIGDPFEFTVPTDFKQATLTFSIDTDKLGDVSIEDLLFLYFDKENQNYQELETVVDVSTNTVSVTTTHFSQYMIVNRNEWLNVWNNNPYNDMVYNELPNQPNASGYISRYPSSKSEALKYSKTFGNSNYLIIEPDKFTWHQAQEFCESFGGHLATITSSDECAFLYSLIRVNTMNEYVLGGTWPANSQPYWTNGEKFVDDAVTLKDNWGNGWSGHLMMAYRLSNCVLKGVGEDYSSMYGFICEWDKDVTLLDSDEDGFPDIYETKGLLLANGTNNYTDPKKNDTDDDGLKDNEEILSEIQVVPFAGLAPSDSQVSNKYYFKMNSIPNMKDSDEDHIEDYFDIYPLKYDTTPLEFCKMYKNNIIEKEDIKSTDDGFYLCVKPVEDILANMNCNYSDSGVLLREYYDDWYFYAVGTSEDYVYSMVKMRELNDKGPDGHDAGIAVPFCALDMSVFNNYTDPISIEFDNKLSNAAVGLNDLYNGTLASYFSKTESKGSYLIGEQYIEKVISESFKDINTIHVSGNIWTYTVLEFGGDVTIANKSNVTNKEKTTILKYTSGSSSLNSLAAEIQVHAIGAISANTHTSFCQGVIEYCLKNNIPFKDIPIDWQIKLDNWALTHSIKADVAFGEETIAIITQDVYLTEEAFFTSLQREVHGYKI